MFAHQHYVPVLKSKKGERDALGVIVDAVKDRLTPLIEIDDVPCDAETSEPTRDLEQHCKLNVDELARTWGTTRKLFLDPQLVAPSQGPGGVDGSEYAFQRAGAAGLQFIPVVGLRRTKPEVAAALKHSQRGLCVRLEEDDLADPQLAATLSQFLQSPGGERDHGDVDIVVDLASVVDQPVHRVEMLARMYLTAVPHIKSWRTLTVAASAFPQTLGAVQRQSTTTLERTEWLAWARLHAGRGSLVRMPTFGDYAIQHPFVMEGYDPRYMPPSANIRYTLDDEWLILKGQSVRRAPGKAQFQALAQALTSDARFMGQGHCKGCAEAHACAGGAAGYGASAPWRRIGTTHHLTHVMSQVAALPFP